MQVSARNHLVFWGAMVAFAVFLVWVLNSVLLPFVLGIGIAYLLNPLVNRLGRMGMSRWLAALFILIGFFAVVIGVFLITGPIIYRELLQLSGDIPRYIDSAWTALEPHVRWVQERIGNANSEELQSFVRDNIGSAVNVVQFVIEKIASGSQAVLGWFALLLLTPIVAFFMMKDWPSVTKWAEDLLPRDSKSTVTRLMDQIDHKIAGFIRGQLSVMALLAIIYAIGLSVIGLKYGFLIGVTAGLLSVIPMVGSAVGLVLSVLVAWFQSGDYSFVMIVAGIFIVGQIFEGHVLTPKLVGGSVGLHPLWVFFALMAGGSLFGVTGMLLAVPAVAAIGVLASYGIVEYKDSAYYRASKPAKKTKKKKTKQVKKKRA